MCEFCEKVKDAYQKIFMPTILWKHNKDIEVFISSNRCGTILQIFAGASIENIAININNCPICGAHLNELIEKEYG